MFCTRKSLVSGLVLAATALVGSIAQAEVYYVSPGWQAVSVYSPPVVIQPVRHVVVARRVVVARPIVVQQLIQQPVVYAQPVYVASEPECFEPIVISRSVAARAVTYSSPVVVSSDRVRETIKSRPHHYRHTYKVDRR